MTSNKSNPQLQDTTSRTDLAGDVNRQSDTGLWSPVTHGITASLLAKFIVCRERFRLLVLEGIKPKRQWNHYLYYGNLFHEAADHHRENRNEMAAIANAVIVYEEQKGEQYDTNDAKHWYQVFCAQFPCYVEYHMKADRRQQVLLSEEVFDLPYVLPSGRDIRLRGKVDCLLEDKKGKRTLFDTKTGSMIDEEMIGRTLTKHLQFMLYCTVLSLQDRQPDFICLDLVRRPLSFMSKNNITARKDEKNSDGSLKPTFYNRLEDKIRGNKPYFFKRITVPVLKKDIDFFRRAIFDPWLEYLLDWYAGQKVKTKDPFQTAINLHATQDIPSSSIYIGAQHALTPYGIHNSLYDGRRGDYYDLITRGSTAGLDKIDPVTDLYGELG